MVGPQRQNPRGERLTPVLLWKGLVLYPPSLDGKKASMKDKVKIGESNEGECCYNKALSSNPRRKRS
jgi:hypothetical protein